MNARSWRTPLVILVCGCLIMCISFGIRAGFGLFLQPMSLEYGWGREVFSFSIALQNLMWGGMAIFSIALVTALSLLELFIAGLQAFIFTFLTAVFIGLAKHPPH